MDRADRGRLGAGYDAVAADYAAHLSDELDYKPLDRALLAMLADEAAGRPIADLGCGPGHVSGWLAHRGAHPVGIDLSPGMVAEAIRLNPGTDFRVGDLCALPADDAEFGAAAVLYSIIHLEPGELPGAFGELRRVLAPGAAALVSFHIGDEVVHRSEWWGHDVDLNFRFFSSDEVEAQLNGAGLVVEARIERAHYPAEVQTRRGYLLARRPTGPS